MHRTAPNSDSLPLWNRAAGIRSYTPQYTGIHPVHDVLPSYHPPSFRAAALPAAACAPPARRGDRHLQRRVQSLVSRGVPVVDIRVAWEWRETGVVPGSRKMMFFDDRGGYDAGAWLASLSRVAGRDEPVILICHTGVRSRVIANWLSGGVGYSRVYNVTRESTTGFASATLLQEASSLDQRRPRTGPHHRNHGLPAGLGDALPSSWMSWARSLTPCCRRTWCPRTAYRPA